MRLCMPDHACKSVDIPLPGGHKIRYAPERNGSVEVDNARHARWLMDGAECFEALGNPVKGGYPCECGFASVFVKCSRCGKENPRG